MRSVRRCEETGSHEGAYRYLLEVDLGVPGRRLAVVGKNPSTAGSHRSDATLGKIEAWALRHGFGAVTLVNLFAVRHTSPAGIMTVSYAAAVGPKNDRWIREAVEGADVVVAAWGDPGDVPAAAYDTRVAEVVHLIGQHRLRVVGSRTARRYPRHGRMWNDDPRLAAWSDKASSAPEGVSPGRAMFLVGPSSSGKSSLGRALVEVLPEPYMFYETDRLALHGPSNRPELLTPEGERLLTRGSAPAIRGYLDAGINLVIERDLWRPDARAMAAEVFAPYEAWLIGLRWDLEQLEGRERQRTDGIFAGTARAQATRPGAWDLPYDHVADVVTHSPPEAAQAISEWLSSSPPPRAVRDIARHPP